MKPNEARAGCDYFIGGSSMVECTYLVLKAVFSVVEKVMLNVSFLICFASVWLLSSPHPSFSQDYCFEEAGKQYGIAPVILWAISKQESRFNPDAINFNHNGTYDFCHMQINSSWASEIGDNAWASLSDTCQCTKVGAWILSQCIRVHGYTWEAIGCYHAKSKHKKVWYSWKIYDALKNLYGYVGHRG